MACIYRAGRSPTHLDSELFTAGMLHDIGTQFWKAIVARADATKVEGVLAEQRALTGWVKESMEAVHWHQI